MTIALQTKGLGKKYTIGTQTAGGYRTLRDTLVNGARGLLKPRVTEPVNSAEFWALQNIDLEIQQGERVGIIGRNGAGKSTLLKLISRITHPTTGEIRINGRVSSLLEVGTGFHPELSGRENIYLNGAILGMSHAEIKRNFDAIVDFSGVEKFLDTPVKRYSSGMYTRLAFAVAAHLESEILIVDEVLAVGDAEFQKKCLGKMEEVGKKDGRTVIFVSHNMNAVQQLCNRAVWIDAGHVKADNHDTHNIITAYHNLIDMHDGLWRHDPAQIHTSSHKSFKPRQFYVGDAFGELYDGPMPNDNTAYIYLEFDVDDADPSLTAGYELYSEDGTLLYWSYFTDTDPDTWPPVKRGRNVIRSQIPVRLLNEGSYRVTLIASLHFREWIYKSGESPIHIDFTIQGGLSDSPLWHVRRYGMFAPVVPWTSFAKEEPSS